MKDWPTMGKLEFDEDDQRDFAAVQSGLEQYKAAMRSIERRHMGLAEEAFSKSNADLAEAHLAVATSAYGFYGDGVSLHERVSKTAARTFSNFINFLLGRPQTRGGGGGGRGG